MREGFCKLMSSICAPTAYTRYLEVVLILRELEVILFRPPPSGWSQIFSRSHPLPLPTKTPSSEERPMRPFRCSLCGRLLKSRSTSVSVGSSSISLSLSDVWRKKQEQNRSDSRPVGTLFETIRKHTSKSSCKRPSCEEVVTPCRDHDRSPLAEAVC